MFIFSKIRDAVQLLGDDRVLDGHVRRVVVEAGRHEQDGQRADDRRDGEHPEKEPVQHHGYKAPVLILLLAGQRSH